MARIELPVRYYRYDPASEPAGESSTSLSLETSATAFLLIDVYGIGFDEDGELDNVDDLYDANIVANRDIIRNRIVPARGKADALGIPIVYCQNHLSAGLTRGSELWELSVRTWNVDILTEWHDEGSTLSYSRVIAPRSSDLVVLKQQASAFFDTSLDSLLRSRGVKNLVMVGFDARICLGMTALDALQRNYRVIVLRDCTSTMEYIETASGQWANRVAIRQIESDVGFTALSVDWIAAS